ncbi:MAG: energy-coupling factor transporter ATPase [Christensenellales bacterium]
MIDIQNISYCYPVADELPYAALKEASLQVQRGEFIAVVGHNGSGKSTLAKMMNVLLLPDEGVVIVDGMDTRQDALTWEIRQCCGMVFQNPDNQLVAGVVEEDVAFGPENLGIAPDEIRRRVDTALAQVHMEQYAKKGPHMLSGGQKQRVAIAGILAMRPAVIIFDEATAMLDPVGRDEVLDIMCMLNQEKGITIVNITHDMEEAALADRIAVMNEGTVCMQGTPQEVFAEVEQIQSAGLDVPPMTELAYLLKHRGIQLDGSLFSTEEMADELCRLL